MKKKEKKLYCFLLVSHLYCFIMGGFNGGKKVDYPAPFFWHFLTWGCVGNGILTTIFISGKLKKPKTNTYWTQLFSLITMISNLITVGIYVLGLSLGAYDHNIKLVPLPTRETYKIIHGWLYSPLWHLILPGFFIFGFFRYEKKNLLTKKLKLTILFSLIMPSLYYLYCFLRSKLSPPEYFDRTKGFSRGPYVFLSSKKMGEKLGISRATGKFFLVVFWFSLFILITYFSLKLIKKNSKNKLRTRKKFRFRKLQKLS